MTTATIAPVPPLAPFRHRAFFWLWLGMDVARAAGPALAGVVIARWGVPPVFAVTAVAAGVFAVILLAWRRPDVTSGERDPFLPALVAGGRYVRNEPVVRRILVRFATFIVPACAMWALLPLIASQQLDLAAKGYGLLFAALGSGAVIAALTLGRVTEYVSSNAIVGLAAVSFGIALGAVALAPSVGLALLPLVVCGFAGTATVSTVISELPRRLLVFGDHHLGTRAANRAGRGVHRLRGRRQAGGRLPRRHGRPVAEDLHVSPSSTSAPRFSHYPAMA
ncbi:MAG: MFS transporter [Candidatus Nanopelagicales bacterium]